MKILKRGHNCWKIGKAESTGLLIDARDYYKAIYDTTAQAQHFILMAGWQFNSDVRLLRGKDAEQCDTDVRLLPYLNALCEANPNLHVYILAWDFLEFFAFKREWRQPAIFNQSKTNRIKLLYDSRHAIGASHHQKLVVVDGNVAFVGGMDLCRERWSDRNHPSFRRHRQNASHPCKAPYHDIQSYHTGPLVRHFVELFRREWARAGGGKLNIPRLKYAPAFTFTPSASFKTGRVAISRTQSRTLFPPQRTVREIRQLYIEGIQAADQLIYIENQYFTSKAIFKALIERMRRRDRPLLQIVLILPHRMKTLAEDAALGFTQARMLRCLKKLAAQTGHSLGIYFTTTSEKNNKAGIPTIIHSKLLLVDDTFLTVGSANAANRSMGLDTELNVAWEAASAEDGLSESLQDIRVSLLSEHAGVTKEWGRMHFHKANGLVETLDHLADSKTSPLQHHQMTTRFSWMNVLSSHGLGFDLEKPIVEERIYRWIKFAKRLGKNELAKLSPAAVKNVFTSVFFLLKTKCLRTENNKLPPEPFASDIKPF